MEGVNGVNWKYFYAQISSWVINLFLSMGLTAAIVAQAVYTPSIYQSAHLHSYEQQLGFVTKGLIKSCNATGLVAVTKDLATVAKIPNPYPNAYMSLLNITLAYYKNNTC
jgi:hypothetical protein